MQMSKIHQHKLYVILLVVYVLFLFYLATVIRMPVEIDHIERNWLWGYHSRQPEIILDNILNICAFVPVGLLLGLIVPRHKMLAAVLGGLFISETIECSQLIWKLGAFDVDDFFNNTVGAFLGGLIAVVVIRMGRKRLICKFLCRF